jgi:uncharacterized protein (DUF302 family)
VSLDETRAINPYFSKVDFRSFDLRLVTKRVPRIDSVTEPSNAVVTKVSPWSVKDTVARLKAIVEARGMKVFAVIDLGAEAGASGFDLRDMHVITFGSTALAAAVMAAHPLVALDVPQKVVVWVDGCETKIGYAEPPALAARYGLAAELAEMLAVIDSVTEASIDR